MKNLYLMTVHTASSKGLKFSSDLLVQRYELTDIGALLI